jgi:hypothetical protein
MHARLSGEWWRAGAGVAAALAEHRSVVAAAVNIVALWMLSVRVTTCPYCDSYLSKNDRLCSS